MLLLFRIADDDMLINIFTQHFLVPPLRLELFQCQRQLCFLYKESFGMFFLSNNKPFHWTVCHTEEAIKTSAITTRATKFIALLRSLYFDTKIHTCALNNFFVCWKRYVAEQVRKKLSWKWEPYLYRLGLIPAKYKQTIYIVIPIPFRAHFKHAQSFCCCVSSNKNLQNRRRQLASLQRTLIRSYNELSCFNLSRFPQILAARHTVRWVNVTFFLKKF